MFVDTWKILEVLEKEPPVMTITVTIEIELAREIYEKLFSQGWMRTNLFDY